MAYEKTCDRSVEKATMQSPRFSSSERSDLLFGKSQKSESNESLEKQN